MVADLDMNALYEDVEWVLCDLAARTPKVALNRAYYDGQQALAFATRYWRNTFGELFRDLSDNLCAPVVDAVVERMVLDGFDGTAANDVETLWNAARMHRISPELHLEAGIAGDAFAIVWPNRLSVPTVWPQAADTCAVDYDPDELGLIRKAGKLWRSTPTTWRLTMYYPDRLVKLVATVGKDNTTMPKASKFALILDGQYGDEVADNDNPWKIVPVAHYAMRAKLGGYGRSELENVRIVQDMLNKSVMDLLVGMEFAGLPQRYGIGVEKPRDPNTGEEIEGNVRAGVDRLWTVKNPAATLGQFDAADLNAIVAVVESFRMEMARVSGTPAQYFQLGGDWPSGTALGRLESRLVHKVEDRDRTCGDGHLQVGQLLLAQAGKTVPAPGDLTPRWSDAAMPDPETELAVSEAKLRVGVSQRQVLKELKYPDDLIDEMLSENAQQGMAAADALAAAEAARAAAFGQ